MANEIELKNIAIIAGEGDFIDGAEVLKALAAGVTEFVEDTEADNESAPTIAETRQARKASADLREKKEAARGRRPGTRTDVEPGHVDCISITL